MSAAVSSWKGLSLSLQVHSSTVSIKMSHLYEMLGSVTGGSWPAKKLATRLVSPVKNTLTGPGSPKLWDPPLKPSASSSLLPLPSLLPQTPGPVESTPAVTCPCWSQHCVMDAHIR